ncbi:hypothetical protein G9A89_001924 [Geosiphon pyriformis]|nr:hypothetical protein G9A89_001924 [Geosiphon pyriformis]
METYSVQPINKENFQETLQRRAYTFLNTLEGKRHIAATHIKHFQVLQKERHNNKLLSVTNEFKKETTASVINNSQNYYPYRRKPRGYSGSQLPELLKQALKENLLSALIDIPPNATI